MNRLLSFLILLLPLLTRAQTGPQLVLNTGGHQAMINDIAVTRDGKTILSASNDKVIRVWNAQTGQLMDEIRGQQTDSDEGMIYAMALSPDDRWLAVGGWMTNGEEGIVRLYDFPKRQLVGLLKGHTDVVFALSFSPDSRHLVSGSADNIVQVWQLPASGGSLLTTPLQTFSGHTDFVYSVVIHGQLVVSASYDKTIKFWQLGQKTPIVTRTEHAAQCDALAISPDGQTIISGAKDQQLLVYDRIGNVLQKLDNQTSATVIRFSPDGQKFVCGSHKESGSQFCSLYERNGREWRRKATYSGHNNSVKAVGFLDNQTVVSTGGRRNEISLWQTNGTLLRSWQGQGQNIRAVGFIPGVLAYTPTFTENRGLSSLTQQFDLIHRTLSELPPDVTFPKPVFQRGIYSLTHTAGGDYGDSDASLLIQTNGKTQAIITRGASNGFYHTCYGFGPGQTVISGGSNGSLYAYDFSGKQLARFVGHTGDVWGLSVSPDEKWLASGGNDQVMKLWSLAELGKKEKIESVATVFIGQDGEWVIWHSSGYYDASPNGEKYIGWHVNRGYNQIADYYPAANFRKKFHQSKFITRLIETGNLNEATKTLAYGQMESIGQQRPPSVQWQFPTNSNLTVSTPTIRVSARVSSASPVQLVKFLVNGRSSYANRGLKIAQVSGTLVEQDVNLQPGENILEILVRNSDGEVLSEKRLITYQPAAHVASIKPILYVLAIGVSSYKDPAYNLSFAHQDALDLTALLKRQHGGLYGQVQVQTLTNAEATRQKIKEALGRLKQLATHRDVVIIMMAGHGKTTSNGTFYFMPHEVDAKDIETTGFFQGDILETLGTFSSKVVLFLDACHAGGIAQRPRFVSRSLEPNLSEFVRELISVSVGVAVFCASQPKEESLESIDFQNGAFTEALLEGLSGKANSDNNAVVTVNELDSYITKRVRQLTDNRQTPGIYKPSSIPDFPLVVPGR